MFVGPFRKSYAHYDSNLIRTKDQRLSWFFGCFNNLLNPKNWELSINLGREGDPSKVPFKRLIAVAARPQDTAVSDRSRPFCRLFASLASTRALSPPAEAVFSSG